jgi:hypothetical protein
MAALLVLVSSAAFGQTKFPLKIQCNVLDADVYVNNKLYTKTTANLQIQLPPGVFSIKIAKAGYSEYSANVTVPRGGTTISVVLQPLSGGAPAPAPASPATPFLPKFPLNVNSSVPGAEVYFNGKFVGNAPLGQTVIGGTYEVVVKAPGYQDFTQRLNVNGPVQINAVLNPAQVVPAPAPIPVQSTLSVNANAPGADVYLNGNRAGQTPFSAQLVPGTYNLVVRAPGYNDYNQTVVVNGPTQINAMLTAIQATLSVNANVPGADIYLNGNRAGQTPFSAQLVPGTYSLVVRVSGYNDFSQTVVVNGQTQINAMLTAIQATLSVNANVPGADVYLNGNRAGQTPFTVQLVPGTYSLVVRAAGYGDYNQAVVVSGTAQVNAILTPLAATWQLSLPAGDMNTNGRGNGVLVFIDGSQQQGVSGQILPGRHSIRLIAGSLVAETAIDVQAGRVYTIEPYFMVNVK